MTYLSESVEAQEFSCNDAQQIIAQVFPFLAMSTQSFLCKMHRGHQVKDVEFRFLSDILKISNYLRLVLVNVDMCFKFQVSFSRV